MNIKKVMLSFLILFICSTGSFAQINENTSIQIFPTFDLGLGNSQIVDLGATIGGGANIKVQHLLDSLPFLFIEGDLNVGVLPRPLSFYIFKHLNGNNDDGDRIKSSFS